MIRIRNLTKPYISPIVGLLLINAGFFLGWFATQKVTLTDLEKDGLMRQDNEHDMAIQEIKNKQLFTEYLLTRAVQSSPYLQKDNELVTWVASR